MAIYIAMIICGLVFIAFPVIYFGQVDPASAILLVSGTGLLVWGALRAHSEQYQGTARTIV